MISEQSLKTIKQMDKPFLSSKQSTNQDTFLMIKPNGLQHQEDILKILSELGFEVTVSEPFQVSSQQAASHYQEHQGKSFYEELINFIQSGEVVAMKVSGINAIERIRHLAGSSKNPEPWTFRGMWADKNITMKNVVHTSDSPAAAKRELDIYVDEILPVVDLDMSEK